MEIIYQTKAGNYSDKLRNISLEIVKIQINKGTQAIIAGCTEIPLVLKNEYLEIPVIDPTLFLAQKAIKETLN